MSGGGLIGYRRSKNIFLYDDPSLKKKIPGCVPELDLEHILRISVLFVLE
jgi:hypothetical protein